MEALQALRSTGEIGDYGEVEIDLERPARKEHGDFSTNVALGLAKSAGIAPRDLAEKIVSAVPQVDIISKIEVAGPGFINFHLSHSWLYDTVVQIAERKHDFGKSTFGKGARINVEFGSPNPTGPITIGNARNIIYGDVLASSLQVAAFDVTRENYINDRGGQMERFAASLEARYRQAVGLDAEVPEDGYQGAYLVDLGKELADLEGMGLVGKAEEIGEWGLRKMVESQKNTLDRLGVHHDVWTYESSLHESGKVTEAVDRLREIGAVYEAEGAVWFKATDYGHGQDRVLVKSAEKGSFPTYLAADTAYLLDKIERGFEKCVYLWGADHHGTVANMQAMARALKIEEHLEIIIYQFVNFVGGGGGKRSGAIVTLDELIDEVGTDAARFTFLTRGPDSTMDFDFDFVKSQSQENPVYYVQYAHARIASVLRYGAEKGIQLGPIAQVPLGELVHESELELLRKLAEYSEVIDVSAKLRAPYRLTTYSRSLAEMFHNFYRDCRVISDDLHLTQARLWLSEATRQVLANVLGLIGITAPEQM